MCRYIEELVRHGVLHVNTQDGLIILFKHAGVYLVYYRSGSGRLIVSLDEDCKPRIAIFRGFAADIVDKKISEVLKFIRKVYEAIKK